jgi:hypothetical protein
VGAGVSECVCAEPLAFGWIRPRLFLKYSLLQPMLLLQLLSCTPSLFQLALLKVASRGIALAVIFK